MHTNLSLGLGLMGRWIRAAGRINHPIRRRDQPKPRYRLLIALGNSAESVERLRIFSHSLAIGACFVPRAAGTKQGPA